jgi:hypothetical protein
MLKGRMIKHKSILILTLVIVGTIQVPELCAAEALELVRHGGFEVASSSGIGEGWASESYGSATVRFGQGNDYLYYGKHSQHIHVEGYRSGGAQIRQLGVNVISGREYEITLWMRSTLATPVKVGFRKHEKPYTYYLTSSFSVSSRWQKYSIVGPVTHDDPNAGLYVSFAGNGDLWIDNVSARVTGPQEVVNPLGLRASVTPNADDPRRWRVEYQVPLPRQGVDWTGRIYVRIDGPRGEPLVRLPLSITLRDGMLVGGGKLVVTSRKPIGTYTVCVVVKYPRDDGSEAVSAVFTSVTLP